MQTLVDGGELARLKAANDASASLQQQASNDGWWMPANKPDCADASADTSTDDASPTP